MLCYLVGEENSVDFGCFHSDTDILPILSLKEKQETKSNIYVNESIA
jgi:hypothetical protein